MIGRRIFSANGSPMTNISFQVSCITGSPPWGALTVYDKRGASSLSENGGSVTRMESQEKPAVREADLTFGTVICSRRFLTRLHTQAFCFRMIKLVGCLQV